MKIEEKLLEILKQNRYRGERKRYEEGELGINSIINLIEKETEFEVQFICSDDTVIRTKEEVLEELFSTVPLPNGLRMYRKRYKENNLKAGAAYNIISEHTNYQVELMLVEKAYNDSSK